MLDLINRYMTSTNEYLLKRKDIVEIKFIISVNYSFNVMQITAMSTWQVLLIYIYVGMSKYWSLTVLCDFVCMCLRVCACVRVCVCVCVCVCV